MNLDKLDLKILKENFDDEMITKIDDENVSKIMIYLERNGIYYAKDLFLLSLDLFLLPYSFLLHWHIYSLFLFYKYLSKIIYCFCNAA